MWRRLSLIGFLALLYLPALGASESGGHPDESYYFGISADMDARGAWLTPTLDGKPLWFKPPLLYWGERICYRLFGRSFFAARLPAALSAIAVALLTGALARRMYGERAALAATLLTATSFGLLKFGRMAMMDAPMTLALTAAAYGTWRASEEGRAPFLLLTGVGAGAATLLKGPVGAVLVLLLSGGYLALRAPRLLATRWITGAFTLGAAIALPWFALSFVVHGQAFYESFIVQQNYDRFRHPWTLIGEATLLVGFLIYLTPWTFLWVSGLRGRWRDPEMLLPLVWIASVLLTFTLPALKWPHYGLSCIPAAALLACRAIPPRWARIATSMFFALLSGLALATLRWPLASTAWRGLFLATAFLAAAALLIALGRLAAGAVSAGLAAVLVLTWVVPSVNPPTIPPAALSTLAGRPLHVYDAIPGSFTLTARQPVRRVTLPEEVTQALEQDGVLILPQSKLEKLPQDLLGRVITLARWRHIPGYLPPRAVWRSWIERNTNFLFEDMIAIALAPPTS